MNDKPTQLANLIGVKPDTLSRLSLRVVDTPPPEPVGPSEADRYADIPEIAALLTETAEPVTDDTTPAQNVVAKAVVVIEGGVELAPSVVPVNDRAVLDLTDLDPGAETVVVMARPVTHRKSYDTVLVAEGIPNTAHLLERAGFGPKVMAVAIVNGARPWSDISEWISRNVKGQPEVVVAANHPHDPVAAITNLVDTTGKPIKSNTDDMTEAYRRATQKAGHFTSVTGDGFVSIEIPERAGFYHVAIRDADSADKPGVRTFPYEQPEAAQARRGPFMPTPPEQERVKGHVHTGTVLSPREVKSWSRAEISGAHRLMAHHEKAGTLDTNTGKADTRWAYETIKLAEKMARDADKPIDWAPSPQREIVSHQQAEDQKILESALAAKPEKSAKPKKRKRWL